MNRVEASTRWTNCLRCLQFLNTADRERLFEGAPLASLALAGCLQSVASLLVHSGFGPTGASLFPFLTSRMQV